MKLDCYEKGQLTRLKCMKFSGLASLRDCKDVEVERLY